jgi:hypothetical protein
MICGQKIKIYESASRKSNREAGKKLFHGIHPITPIYAKIKNAGLPRTNPVIQGLA